MKIKPSKNGIDYNPIVYRTEYDMLAWWIYSWMVAEYRLTIDVPDIVWDAVAELQKTLAYEEANVYGLDYVDERAKYC